MIKLFFDRICVLSSSLSPPCEKKQKKRFVEVEKRKRFKGREKQDLILKRKRNVKCCSFLQLKMAGDRTMQ